MLGAGATAAVGREALFIEEVEVESLKSGLSSFVCDNGLRKTVFFVLGDDSVQPLRPIIVQHWFDVKAMF